MTDTQTISAKIQSYRDKANQAKQVYTAARDSINADNTRTSEWKREQTRAARATLARELEQTEQAEKAYIATTTKELDRQVFGIKPGQDVLAYRDAQDRVREIHWNDEDSAIDLYRQAERSSDTTLMQALSQRSVTAGWARVQEAHAAQNPEQGSQVEALASIEAFNRSAHQTLMSAAEYSMPNN